MRKRLTPKRTLGVVTTVLLAMLVAGLSVVLVLAVFAIPDQSVRLAAQLQDPVPAERLLHDSGVRNPVTSVLLNFRAYDTLLELVVVILAVLGVQAITPTYHSVRTRRDPLLGRAVAILVPVCIVVAGNLLWMGADRPGGAFQAAAVLGGAGIMLILSGRLRNLKASDWRLRLATVAGVGVFVTVGVALMLWDQSFLQYASGHAKSFILAIETAAMISVAAAFVWLFHAVARSLVTPDDDAPQSAHEAPR